MKSSYKTTQQKYEETDIDDESSLVPSIKKEEITIIKGIGPKVAERLNDIGVSTVADLAKATPERISNVHGIGLSTAQKYVANAIEHMRMKKLNDFSKVQEPINTVSEVVEDSTKEFEPIQEDIDAYKVSESSPEVLEYEEIDQQIGELEDENDLNSIVDDNSEAYETGADIFEDESTSLESPETLKPKNIPQISSQVVIPPEVIRQSDIVLEKRNAMSEEVLSQAQIKELEVKITKILKLSEFNIIEQLPKLRSIFTGIDLLAIKHVRVKEFLDLIYILPIKICSLKGSLIVSSEDVNYKPSKDIENIPSRVVLIPQSYLKALSQVKMAIYSDILSEGALLKYLSRYLGLDITLEKSITRKILFFRSGPLQHKIFVEPILICQNTVGFTEKIIPFAYQKNSNIHIVEHSKFADLLQYLDQKYFLIETYSEEKNAVVLNCEATNKFMKDLRTYSAPFMVYGIVVLFILLLQAYSALPLIINLGYGVVSLYIVVVGYLYLKLYKEKTEIHREFSTPYYQKKPDLDESTLILINEEISSKYMDQFTFECIGKNSDSNFISKRETKNAEKFLTERAQERRIEESNIFESNIATESAPLEPLKYSHTPKEEGNSSVRDKYVNKYSLFLED